ncbi:hypothetical protein PsorP6_018193 [Peronosclerospora sorghi]|uniref:Uncharacterized protein n=1 Tax=Peronosclerospora sorghi TaxID=230839 RepID=A0ACC0WF92_9STRA|nr:hypothetical protein PsorP6_018193 [Peronosclerospora sorghi]
MRKGKHMEVNLAANPSHLEAVNPVRFAKVSRSPIFHVNADDPEEVAKKGDENCSRVPSDVSLRCDYRFGVLPSS